MMVLRSLRLLLVATAATTVCAPGSSEGCEFLRRLFGGGEQTTYMPVVAPVCSPCSSCAAPATSYYAPGCATCVSPAVPVTAGYTAYYAPQTYYRPVVQNVAVTAYRPVAAYNPYTGSIQTAYRPVTTYRPQWTYSPYTSYRIAYAPTAYYPTYYSSAVAPVASGCTGCSTPVMGTTVTGELSPIPSSSASGWSNSAPSPSTLPQSTVVAPQTKQDPQSTVAPDLRGAPSTAPLPREDDRTTLPPYGSGGAGSGNGASQPTRPSSTTGSPSSLISPPAERTTFRAQLPKIGFNPEAAPQVMLASRQAAAGPAPVVSADGWEAAE